MGTVPSPLILRYNPLLMKVLKVLIPIALFLISFSLLYAVFGGSGYLVNRSLGRALEALEKEEEERRLEIEALERRMAQARSDAAYNDIALSLGYNQEGDVVYYFSDEDEPGPGWSGTDPVEEVVVWEGVPSWILALAALALTVALCALCALLLRRHGRAKDDAWQRDVIRRGDDFDW